MTSAVALFSAVGEVSAGVIAEEVSGVAGIEDGARDQDVVSGPRLVVLTLPADLPVSGRITDELAVVRGPGPVVAS